MHCVRRDLCKNSINVHLLVKHWFNNNSTQQLDWCHCGPSIDIVEVISHKIH